MAVFIRAKHATDPLDERVRARLCGELTDYDSIHDAAPAGDPSFFSLHAFLDTDGDGKFYGGDSDSESSTDSVDTADSADSAIAMLRDLLEWHPSADPLRFRLVLEVESAVVTTPGLSGWALRRAVMEKLRERGYNAGICMARWQGGGALTAGSYEYIDVVLAAAEMEEMRYIVDVGFADEFEVARATEEYRMVAAALPLTVVARPEDVKAVVRIMAESARRSLKIRGMSVPPWRKKRFMMAKWLGSYRRTVNSLPAVTEGGGRLDVRSRMVGFGRFGD
ncbi:hypothetical protein KSP39_PZI019137 [Platanthera zijinensis]|uniref:Tyrosinase copper-binding domain-containing protein n=1 Tax=Platanthera zijinensis TaxID=2320716 RepID=A0AAP0FXV3_9ASPA